MRFRARFIIFLVVGMHWVASASSECAKFFGDGAGAGSGACSYHVELQIYMGGKFVAHRLNLECGVLPGRTNDRVREIAAEAYRAFAERNTLVLVSSVHLVQTDASGREVWTTYLKELKQEVDAAYDRAIREHARLDGLSAEAEVRAVHRRQGRGTANGLPVQNGGAIVKGKRYPAAF